LREAKKILNVEYSKSSNRRLENMYLILDGLFATILFLYNKSYNIKTKNKKQQQQQQKTSGYLIATGFSMIIDLGIASIRTLKLTNIFSNATMKNTSRVMNFRYYYYGHELYDLLKN